MIQLKANLEIPGKSFYFSTTKNSRGRRIAIDENDNKWHEITSFPNYQMFFSLIAQDVFSISPIVCTSIDGEPLFLSKEVDLDTVAETHSLEETYGESFLMEIFFNEGDQGGGGEHPRNVNIKQVSSDTYKLAHFDFQSFALNFHVTHPLSHPKMVFNVLRGYKRDFPQRFEFCKNKFECIKQTFSGDPGLSFLIEKAESLPTRINRSDVSLLHKRINMQIEFFLAALEILKSPVENTEEEYFKKVGRICSINNFRY